MGGHVLTAVLAILWELSAGTWATWADQPRDGLPLNMLAPACSAFWLAPEYILAHF